MISFAQFLQEIETQMQQPKTIEQVAEEFYNYMGGRFPGCSLGVAGISKTNPGSGNCAWTARRFWVWSQAMLRKFPGVYEQGKIILFPDSDRESSAHLVPVYQGTIIDYIQAFTGGQKYQFHKVANITPGIHPLEEGGPDVKSGYEDSYDEYIFGNSIEEINAFQARRAEEEKRRGRVQPFDRPRVMPQQK